MRGHVRKRCACPKVDGRRKCQPGCKAPWVVVVDLGRDPATKQRRQKWHAGNPPWRTKAEAERALTEIVGRINRNEYVAPTKQTLAQFLTDDWLPAIKATVRPSTLHSYDRNLRLHVIPAIGSQRLVTIDGAALNALYAGLATNGRKDYGAGRGLSPRSIAYVHTILHRAFKDAVKWNRLTRNPADAAQPPKASANEATHAQMRTWSAEQLSAFLSRSAGESDRYYSAWLTLATTGVRRGELLGLRWADVDLDAARASIRQTVLANVVDGKRVIAFGTPKTGKGKRQIALDATTVAALRTLRKVQLEERLALGAGYADLDLVFCHLDGRPYHPERFSREFDRRITRYGVPKIRLHDLRHTHATLGLANGVHPRVMQERLGHANVSITLNTYSHVTPAMDAGAADVIASAIFGGTPS